nr:retrotransposon protein, putative, Ty1-copia subclass [Tanacetum cinerariifolium]
QTDNGTEFVNQTLREYYEEVGISHETSGARSPQQNGVVERHNCTLIEAARTIKNLGKLQPKADIGIFISYAPTKKAFRIYNRRTRRIVETIHVDFDELMAMAFEKSSSGPALNEMNLATISSGLIFGTNTVNFQNSQALKDCYYKSLITPGTKAVQIQTFIPVPPTFETTIHYNPFSRHPVIPHPLRFLPLHHSPHHFPQPQLQTPTTILDL